MVFTGRRKEKINWFKINMFNNNNYNGLNEYNSITIYSILRIRKAINKMLKSDNIPAVNAPGHLLEICHRQECIYI